MARLSFTFSASTLLSNLTTKLLPPVKSIPYLKPLVNIEPIQIATKITEITYITFLFPTKSTQRFRNRFLVIGVQTDREIEQKLYEGLKSDLPANFTIEEFRSSDKNPVGIISSTKVGPTVADDIKVGGAYAVIGSLIGIFAYILVRFRRWQFSLGATLGLAFDSIIILGAFSLFYNVMPFNMEINQDFIAAILTVLGYSINDTVIIFDRIREYLKDGQDRTLKQLFNDSISSTMGRTINTSLTVLLVVLSIFVFGGENLRGFMFALLLGIVSGTFSTIFISSLLAFDFLKGKKD